MHGRQAWMDGQASYGQASYGQASHGFRLGTPAAAG